MAQLALPVISVSLHIYPGLLLPSKLIKSSPAAHCTDHCSILRSSLALCCKQMKPKPMHSCTVYYPPLLSEAASCRCSCDAAGSIRQLPATSWKLPRMHAQAAAWSVHQSCSVGVCGHAPVLPRLAVLWVPASATRPTQAYAPSALIPKPPMLMIKIYCIFL